eukprot:472346_1
MRIIKSENINAIGLFLEEESNKQTNINTYLGGIIGEFVNDNMLQHVCDQILSNPQLLDMNSHQLAEFICYCPIKNLQNNLVDDEKNNIDGLWVIDNMNNNKFVNITQQ